MKTKGQFMKKDDVSGPGEGLTIEQSQPVCDRGRVVHQWSVVLDYCCFLVRSLWIYLHRGVGLSTAECRVNLHRVKADTSQRQNVENDCDSSSCHRDSIVAGHDSRESMRAFSNTNTTQCLVGCIRRTA